MIRQNIIDYIKHTPHNFNPSIFNGILDKYISNISQFYGISNLTKVEDFLYSIEYNDVDYAAGDEYCKKMHPSGGKCSAVYANGYCGRNLDWYYDNTAHFVVKVNSNDNRYASYAVASVPGLTEQVAQTGKWEDYFAILPNIVLDGMNAAGLFFCLNVVPNGDYGQTTGTNPGKDRLCARQVGRYLLDNANSVEEAIGLLQEKDIWMPHSDLMDEEFHFMVADATTSCVIEFVNNQMVVLEGAAAMTNFYLNGVEFNEDGSVYTPATSTEGADPITTNYITPHGCGLERYNMINAAIDSITDEDSMAELMQSLYYTNTYVATPNENSWYSEMADVKFGITLDSPMILLQTAMRYSYGLYDNRDRTRPDTWQTVHMTTYDTNNLTLHVYAQEGTTAHEFSF